MYTVYHTVITNKNGDVYHYFGRHREIPGTDYFGTGKFIKRCYSDNDKIPGTWKFSKTIIKSVETYKEAVELEAEVIKKHKAVYGEKCVNISPGGAGGVDFHTNESKDMMSRSRTGVSRIFSDTHKLNCSLWQRTSDVWSEDIKSNLYSQWIRFGKPKRGRFCTLLNKNGYNYTPNQLGKLVKHFNMNEENTNEIDSK